MAPDQAVSLTIAPAAWSGDAEHLLHQANEGAALQDVRDQVQAGTARLFLLAESASAAPCGAFVLRIDQTATGPQGVIVSAAGQRAGVNMIEAVLPHIEGLFQGVRSIRYHTRNPALARRLAARGYAPAEIVSVKHL